MGYANHNCQISYMVLRVVTWVFGAYFRAPEILKSTFESIFGADFPTQGTKEY